MVFFLLISGPDEVIILYWVSDGPCHYVVYKLDLDRAPRTKETLSDFC